MNKDTWVGIAGAALLIAAMVGVFAYERANAPAAGATLQGMLQETTGPTAAGTLALGNSGVHALHITEANARNVTFHVKWSATNGRDALRVTVAPPEGSAIPQGGTDTSDTGEISITVPVPQGTSSAGAWQVKVEFTAATPAPLPGGIPPPTPPPGSTDSSVSYTLATRLA